MKKILCDMCGDDEANTLTLTSKRDGMGYSPDGESEEVDLCLGCMEAFAKSYLILAAIPPSQDRDESGFRRESGFEAVNRRTRNTFSEELLVIHEDTSRDDFIDAIERFSRFDTGFTKFVKTIMKLEKWL